MDKEPCAGSVACDSAELTTALNQLVDMAMTKYKEWDRLVIMEHDMIPPTDGFVRMASMPEGADIVSGVYFRHDPPHNPYVYLDIGQEDNYGIISPETVQKWVVEEPGLYEVAATGFGFMGIHRRVLENWDPDIPMFDIEQPWGTQDFSFCTRARAQGFKLYVDTNIVCGHLTLAPVTLEDHQRLNPLDVVSPHENGKEPTNGDGKLSAHSRLTGDVRENSPTG